MLIWSVDILEKCKRENEKNVPLFSERCVSQDKNVLSELGFADVN